MEGGHRHTQRRAKNSPKHRTAASDVTPRRWRCWVTTWVHHGRLVGLILLADTPSCLSELRMWGYLLTTELILQRLHDLSYSCMWSSAHADLHDAAESLSNVHCGFEEAQKWKRFFHFILRAERIHCSLHYKELAWCREKATISDSAKTPSRYDTLCESVNAAVRFSINSLCVKRSTQGWALFTAQRGNSHCLHRRSDAPRARKYSSTVGMTKKVNHISLPFCCIAIAVYILVCCMKNA